MSNDNEFGTPATVTPATPAPKRPAPRRASARQDTSAPKDKAVKATQQPEDPMDRLVCITLHDGDHIPPGGQFVGVNGKQFWIKPGIKVLVPRYVTHVLDNAVQGVPNIDEKMRVLGTRDAPRLSYTVHLDESF